MFSKFPQWFLQFLLEAQVTALTARPSSLSLLCSLHPKVPFFLGPLPASKFVFTFQVELPSSSKTVQKPPWPNVWNKAKSVGQSYNQKAKTVSSITTCFHISSTSERSSDNHLCSDLHFRAFQGCIPTAVFQICLYHCSYKQIVKQSASVWLDQRRYNVDGWRLSRVHSVGVTVRLQHITTALSLSQDRMADWQQFG